MSEARDLWLQERKTGIGGSDVAAVLGISPWRKPFDVWLDKRGESTPQEPSEAMRWGTILEDLVAQRYSADTGTALYNPQRLYRHPQFEILLATPDRLVMDRNTGKPAFGFEAKTASVYARDEWGEPGTDAIPQHYLAQCVHYMTVLQVPRWDVSVLIGGSDWRTYTVHKDPELQMNIVDYLLDWWNRHIVQGEEPKYEGEGAKRWLLKRFPRDLYEVVDATNEAEQYVSQLREARANLERYTSQEEIAKNNLKLLIGQNAGIAAKGWRATWKRTKSYDRVAWSGYAEALERALVKAGGSASDVATLRSLYTATEEGPRRFLFVEK